MRWLDRPRLHSLSTQLAVATALAMMLTSAVVGLVFLRLTSFDAERFAQHGVLALARYAADHMSVAADGRPLGAALWPGWDWAGRELPDDLAVRIVGADGRTWTNSGRPGQLIAGVDVPLTPGSAQLVVGGRTVNVWTLQKTANGRSYTVQVAMSTRLHLLATEALRMAWPSGMAVTAAGSLPVLIALMVWTLRRLLRPLQVASAAAARIDARNLSARVATQGVPAELLPLIAAFNAALDRLESGFRVQQSFLEAAAHELKTPLALMRGQVELRGNADPRILLQDIDAMTRQVHQLLHLAEVSEPRNYHLVALDPAEVAVLVDEFLGRMAATARVHVDVRLPDASVRWLADESALFTLLKNLVENAIQHSPTGGVVTLSVAPEHIDVVDEGPGIAGADAPHLFERYWRSAAARATSSEGAGLGLAICREIVLAHGWRLETLPAKAGAHFRLALGASLPPV